GDRFIVKLVDGAHAAVEQHARPTRRPLVGNDRLEPQLLLQEPRELAVEPADTVHPASAIIRVLTRQLLDLALLPPHEPASGLLHEPYEQEAFPAGAHPL